MRARTIKKMQVPAYAPIVDGVHWLENNGVLCTLVKAIAMEWPALCEAVSMFMSIFVAILLCFFGGAESKLDLVVTKAAKLENTTGPYVKQLACKGDLVLVLQ
jgi:hypothetical protein